MDKQALTDAINRILDELDLRRLRLIYSFALHLCK